MSSVSVIIPFYKDYAYIKQAVHSVLAENLPECEVVIVNDNPCDRTDTFLKNCGFSDPVRIVTHETNRGLSAARNTGVDESSGDYIAYLDADDFFLPQGLRRQLDWAYRSDAEVCHCVTVLREQRGITRPSHSILARDKRFFQVNRENVTLADKPALQFIVSSWQSIYKRDFLERTGIRFDESQKKFEDRLYVLETVFSDARFALTDVPARVWRRRRDSITTSAKSVDDIKMMAALIDKCTGLAEAAVREERIEPINLQREVVHSLSRLLYELPVLDMALGDDDVALSLREILTRSLSRAEPNREIFSDPLVQSIVVDRRRNKDGNPVTLAHVENVWGAIAAGDWEKTIELQSHLAKTGEAERAARQVAVEPDVSLPAPAVVEGSERFADRTLILHVGLHKTGTTHLQRQLDARSEALKKVGVLFPQTGFVDHTEVAVKPYATPGHHEFVKAIAQKNTKFFEAFEQEVSESDAKTILLSCENLSFPYMSPDQRVGRAENAKQLFRNFPNRRIVATIRRPDQYFESMYRERVTNTDTGESRSILEFLNEHKSGLLDFATMLEPWRNFADGNITLVNYDVLRESKDYVSKFLAEIGMPVPAGIGKKSGSNFTYESPHWDEIELIRLISSTIQDHRKRKALSASLLNSMRPERASKQDKSILSVDDRLEIIEENRSLCEAFFTSAGFNFDFDAIKDEIEADRARDSEPSTLDHDLFEALLNALHTYDALSSVHQKKAKPRRGSEKGSTLMRIRSTLMPVYRNMPDPIKSVARSGYRMLSGQKAGRAPSNQRAGA